MSTTLRYFVEKLGDGFYQGDLPTGRPTFNQRVDASTPSFVDEPSGAAQISTFDASSFAQPGDTFRVVSAEVIDTPAP